MIYIDGAAHRVVDEEKLVDELFNDISKRHPESSTPALPVARAKDPGSEILRPALPAEPSKQDSE